MKICKLNHKKNGRKNEQIINKCKTVKISCMKIQLNQVCGPERKKIKEIMALL